MTRTRYPLVLLDGHSLYLLAMSWKSLPESISAFMRSHSFLLCTRRWLATTAAFILANFFAMPLVCKSSGAKCLREAMKFIWASNKGILILKCWFQMRSQDSKGIHMQAQRFYKRMRTSCRTHILTTRCVQRPDRPRIGTKFRTIFYVKDAGYMKPSFTSIYSLYLYCQSDL